MGRQRAEVRSHPDRPDLVEVRLPSAPAPHVLDKLRRKLKVGRPGGGKGIGAEEDDRGRVRLTIRPGGIGAGRARRVTRRFFCYQGYEVGAD